MPNLLISSVGTSLLTNPPIEDHERRNLIQLANKENYENEEHENLIANRKNIAIQKLKENNPQEIRKASAELNGIYGIYGGKLPDKCQDMHFLITTDTIQGRITAEIVREFLNEKGIAANVVALKKFSTESKTHFSEGIQHLLKWCDETIAEYQEKKYKIIFNLTGGFKSQQGFMNTIGMFYADKIVYIFESANELLEIPKLPILIDKTPFEKYKSIFLQHYAGRPFQKQDFQDIPETLYDTLGDDVHPSIWGELSWNKVKTEILSKQLVELPNLIYEKSFEKDFEATAKANDKVKLQETLAKVSHLLHSGNGDIGVLRKDGGLQYENYANGIGHFRVSQSLRVSCQKEGVNLRLRHFGEHNYVNDNP